MGEAKLVASDPGGDPLKVTWVLQGEPEKFGSGGDKERAAHITREWQRFEIPVAGRV